MLLSLYLLVSFSPAELPIPSLPFPNTETRNGQVEAAVETGKEVVERSCKVTLPQNQFNPAQESTMTLYCALNIAVQGYDDHHYAQGPPFPAISWQIANM